LPEQRRDGLPLNFKMSKPNPFKSVIANGYTRAFFVEMGRRGGKAAAKKMTREQRRDSARRAALARWQR